MRAPKDITTVAGVLDAGTLDLMKFESGSRVYLCLFFGAGMSYCDVVIVVVVMMPERV